MSFAQAAAPCPVLMHWLAASDHMGPMPANAPVAGLFVAPHDDFADSYMPIIRNSPVSVFAPARRGTKWNHGGEDKLNKLELSPHFNLQQEAYAPKGLAWTRDYLPILVRNLRGDLEFAQFNYHEKNFMQSLELYDDFAKGLADLSGIALKRSTLILQGGNLIVDNQGNIFLTEQVILENKKKTRSDIELELIRRLYAKSVTWLPRLPRAVDQTGHLDMYAFFVGQNTFVMSDSKDANAKEVIDKAAKILADKGYTIVRIANAEEKDRNCGQLLFKSYTNSTLVNGTVMMPVYGNNATDLKAKRVYENLGFRVKPINVDRAIKMGGSVHCLTKEIYIDLTVQN